MQSLHQSYEDWLIHEKQGKPPAPVLVLDADQGIDNMITTYEQYKVVSWLSVYFYYKQTTTFQDEIRGLKPYQNPKLVGGRVVKTLISWFDPQIIKNISD